MPAALGLSEHSLVSIFGQADLGVQVDFEKYFPVIRCLQTWPTGKHGNHCPTAAFYCEITKIEQLKSTLKKASLPHYCWCLYTIQILPVNLPVLHGQKVKDTGPDLAMPLYCENITLSIQPLKDHYCEILGIIYSTAKGITANLS